MTLTNEDLAPVPPDRRTWGARHYAALWIGMAVCIPTYMLAASLIDAGMSWWQALLCVAIGNTVVLVPMLLNAHAGARYGIPFPVFARASFGVLGANVPAVLRALVACGWFGIQTWIGGDALHKLAVAVGGGAPVTAADHLPLLGVTFGQLACFLVFWLVNVWFILHGTESIKWLETWSAPFLIACGLALLAWAWTQAGGLGPILDRPSSLRGGSELMKAFAPGVTAMVGFWATLSLNIPDFTRYAKSQRDHVVGQSIGLPGTMILFAFIGIAVTSATPLIFGVAQPIWDPVGVLARIGGIVVTPLCMLALSVATLTTNLAANVVSPANDFSNLAPSRISYKTGGMITAVVGLLVMPWKLIESSRGYVFTWLIGYSALLGPIGGIMIADYFVLRRKELAVADLYRRGGAYEYLRGVNPAAIAALVAGVAVNVPGFLLEAVPSWKESFDPVRDPVLGFFREIYAYAWFVGFLLSGGLYLVLARLSARPGDSSAASAAARSGSRPSR
jgi:NCS1 family nucleobase:cation symporter-1